VKNNPPVTSFANFATSNALVDAVRLVMLYILDVLPENS
jgi:hypothetical protein